MYQAHKPWALALNEYAGELKHMFCASPPPNFDVLKNLTRLQVWAVVQVHCYNCTVTYASLCHELQCKALRLAGAL